MTSSLCKTDEHEVCAPRRRTPAGKLFRCDCGCHPKPDVVKPKLKEERDGRT